ncbi:MAG: tetratricopeptide repeat protein, partial [Bryobacteraceae bacterium]
SSGWWEVWRPLQTRPLTYFTFWANYQLSGQNAFSYHAVNLSIHLGCVWLLFDVLKKLMPANAAFLATAVFAVHPIQTEAVAYIFARGTLLATLFCLLALREWTAGRHWRAVPWFGVALLAKEECVAFPLFLFLLYLSISRNTKELKPIGVMLLLSIAAGLRLMLATAITPGSGAGLQADFTPVQYLATQGGVILRYFRLLILPWGFTVDPDISAKAMWWAWLIVLALAAAAMWQFPRAQKGFWFLAGLILLLPSSSFLPAADLAADRRMYLPMIAFAGLATWDRLKFALPVLIALSVMQTQVWTSGEKLWTQAAGQAPNKLRPKIQLARAVEPARAIPILEQAKNLAPDDPAVASELGRVYAMSGFPDKALSQFGRALALQPNSAQALTNRGVALQMLQQTDAARQDFERALTIDPCLPEARSNAARLGAKVPPCTSKR